MTDITPQDNPGELAGAYALDALAPAEAAAFEAHLAGSEPARIEAAELSDTAVALGLATSPVRPSAGLKASLMARLASTPQLAPLAAPVAEPPAPVVQAPPVTPTPGPVAFVGEPSQYGTTGGPNAAERARKRWFQRPVGLLVAAAAAVALFGGGAVAGQSFTTNQFEQAQASGLAEINAAADVQRASATTADGQKATLVWSGKRGLSALLVDGLPTLPADKDYQLWYIGGSGAVPAGTFRSTGSGTVWRVLDGTMSAGDAIGVTIEPKGGSAQPTTKPIVTIQSS